MKTLGIIFITCLLYSGLAFSDYILFNQTGERIHLKDDGTWENLGVPEKKDGLVVTNTKLMDREYLYDGEKRVKCAITATIQNNTPYDLKRFGLSYGVYDDYDDYDSAPTPLLLRTYSALTPLRLRSYSAPTPLLLRSDSEDQAGIKRRLR